MVLSEIVVIGAGPAGLGAAMAVGPRVRVLEALPEPFGLCRSFELNGCIFDLGGHAFFTNIGEIESLVTGRVKLHSQPRQAWVASHGSVIRYPFQSHLAGLPADVIADCLAGLLNRNGPAGPDMRSWILATFGPGIARHFMEPYNTKVWAFDLATVEASWTGARVVQPDIREIVEGSLAPRDYRKYPNATVRYPAVGGFAELFRPFARDLADQIELNERVVEVDPTGHTIQTERGEIVRYDRLISTMPLDVLVTLMTRRPECAGATVPQLRHNSVRLVNLVVDARRCTDMQRLYCADPAVPFHKLVFNGNSSPTLALSRYTAIQAEVSHSSEKPLPGDLEQAVVESLRALEILSPGDVVVAMSSVDIPYAYPVGTSGTTQAVASLRAELARWDIYTCGRFGEWGYMNSDRALHRGLETGRAVARGGR